VLEGWSQVGALLAMEDESIGRAIVNGELRLLFERLPQNSIEFEQDWNTYENLRCHWVYQHRCLRRM